MKLGLHLRGPNGLEGVQKIDFLNFIFGKLIILKIMPKLFIEIT